MKVYSKIIFPLLAKSDAERSHDATLRLLEFAQQSRAGRFLLRSIAGEVPRKETVVAGVSFPNILGIAAGFDKNARVIRGLSVLGFGHVEIGTVTPASQTGNPKPRIKRLRSNRALINRMGFPNDGAELIKTRLKKLSGMNCKSIIGVSIGKQKDTPINEAVQDYLDVMRIVYRYADYLAVNISSPNTPGLRALHQSSYLDELLSELALESAGLASRHGIIARPLFVKLSPDLSPSELDSVLDVSVRNRINGVIATNTTIDRSNLDQSAAEMEGGLSGHPLRSKSCRMITYISQQLGGSLPIIGVGGIFSSSDVRAKLDAGAILVQVYTGLVYEGPGLAGQILRELYSMR